MKKAKQYTLPFVFSPVHAGFPSPAEDFASKRLNINELLIKHPQATFFVRVAGDSMINDGFYPGDILVVDKSLTAITNRHVIAILNGEFTFKRFIQKNKHIYLYPANEAYKPILITESDDFAIWGVVICAIHYPPQA